MVLYISKSMQKDYIMYDFFDSLITDVHELIDTGFS